MSDATISLLVMALVVVLFVWNRLPVEVVAVGSALLLYFTGVVTLPEALAGFGDPAVLLIAALFVVSEGLDTTGVTAWLGQNLVARSGSSARRMLLLTMLLCAVMTALIGLNGAVAALLPMAVVMSVKQQHNTSQLLIPMVFAGSAGGLLLLTGSPVNVIVSEAAAVSSGADFGYAQFALVGIPLLLGTVAIAIALGGRLLPHRSSSDLPADLSGQAATLVEHYNLDNVFHLRLTPQSPLVGSSRGSWVAPEHPGLRMVTTLDGRTHAPTSEGELAAGDRLTIVGDPQVALRYARDINLVVEAVRDPQESVRSLITRENGAAEVVVPPRSRFVGESVRPGQVVNAGSLIVIAIQRQGRDQGSGPVQLLVGDVLLVEGDWQQLEDVTKERDLLVVDSPDLVRRQAVPLGARSGRTLAVLGIMVVLLATGLVPAVVAALLAAIAMVVLNVVPVQQAYRSIAWTTVLLVAGMMPMSTAITKSGAGNDIAELLIGAVGGAGPTALLVALFALTVVFGQLISNTATALVVIPIAVSAADQLGISSRPVLMCVLVAATAAFLTPVATPPNMMVMGPGGYRFGDYWKLGLPLVAMYFVVAVGLVPLIWRF